MKLAIIGRGEALFDTAVLLREKGHEITLVITAREAPEYLRTAADFERLAATHRAQFVHSASLDRPDVAEAIDRAGEIHVAVSMNFPTIISQRAVDRFPIGILNAHAGDLPRYRGNACVAWAILNNEPKVGLCVHKMVGGELDSGEIIARAYFDLGISVRIGQVIQWINTETPNLMLQAITKLADDPTYFLEKQAAADALRCYARQPDDGRIDWTKTNVEVLRLINASSEPYSGAFATFEGARMTIWRAELVSDQENYLAVPGQVATVEAKSGSIVVICGSGKLRLTEIGNEGGRWAPATIIKSTRKRLT